MEQFHKLVLDRGFVLECLYQFPFKGLVNLPNFNLTSPILFINISFIVFKVFQISLTGNINCD